MVNMKTNPKCRVCGTELNDENWNPSQKERHWYICKRCNAERCKHWRKTNIEKAKAGWTRANRKAGKRPMSENKECAAYLGVYVAERVLSHVFKNVQRMPYGNSGYDFICGRGYKIDVKSACKRMSRNQWTFHIRCNQIADYFLCLAFDNREDLNPLHIWLIPGDVLNHLKFTSVASSTIHKWDAYKLDVEKVTACCNALRETP